MTTLSLQWKFPDVEKAIFVLKAQYWGSGSPESNHCCMVMNGDLMAQIGDVTMDLQGAEQINGLVQECSNSIALAMELLQYCIEP